MAKDAAPKEDLLQQFKDILLTEDRQKLERLQETVQDEELLRQQVIPIIQEQLQYIKTNFPEEFRTEVQEIIDTQIKQSQQQILDTIYPVMGKMIRKYIGYQIQSIKENLEAQLNQGFIGRIRAYFSGVNRKDAILNSLGKLSIEGIYLIEKDSGILLSHKTKEDVVDKDLLAGMLTAIKAFVEDAFGQGQQDLEMIEYETYKIKVIGFPRYYIAVILSGTYTIQEREKMVERIYDFEEEIIRPNIKKIEETTIQTKIANQLEAWFIGQKEIQEKTVLTTVRA